MVGLKRTILFARQRVCYCGDPAREEPPECRQLPDPVAGRGGPPGGVSCHAPGRCL